MLPAVGQGALCIEIRQNDPLVEPVVATLEHPQTREIVLGERAFLNRLEGGCQVPIAAHGTIHKNAFTLTGLVATVDGNTLLKETLSGSEDSSEIIGTNLAGRLIDMGAMTIIENLKSDLEQANEK
jgi:hydroxymethylbilane synthase